MTDKLRKAIAEWEEEAGEPFIYLSRPYSELMEEQRMEEERELEGERQRRGTQFICFTGTKVHILTQLRQRRRGNALWRSALVTYADVC